MVGRGAGAAAGLMPLMGAALEMTADPDPGRRAAQAAELTHKAAKGVHSSPTFQTGRFLVALLLFAALLGGGLVPDIYKLTASSSALYGLAATVLGTVIAFVGEPIEHVHEDLDDCTEQPCIGSQQTAYAIGHDEHPLAHGTRRQNVSQLRRFGPARGPQHRRASLQVASASWFDP